MPKLLTASAADTDLFLSMAVLQGNTGARVAFSSVLLSTLTGIRSIPAYKHGIIVFGSRIAENGAGKDLQKSSHLLLGPEAKPAVLEMFMAKVVGK